MKPLLDNICEVIGETPMVNLSRLVKAYGLDGRILAKLEYFSPGHSKKDRVALSIIEDAEKSGRLRKGMSVIELTSGNTGTGLAVVCSAKGYEFIAVMSAGNSPERVRMITSFGGRVVLVKQMPGGRPGQVSGEDLKLVEDETVRLMEELGAFRADQFVNRANTLANIKTGNEMWEQCAGKIDAFVDFAGTGGTFAGCSEALRSHNSDIDRKSTRLNSSHT